KLVLFHVTAHGQLFMRGKDFAQKRLIPRRDAKFADFGGFVLARYGRKSLKGIETYNLTADMIGFIHAPKGREQCHILAPTNAELHDDSLGVQRLEVQVMHEEYSRQCRAVGIQS